MNSISLVESPLQLLNAYEAESYFKSQTNLYLVRLSNDIVNDEQILGLLEFLLLREKSTIFTINSKKKGFIDLFKIFFLKFYITYISKKFETLFIGNIESGLFSFLINKIKKEKIILLDDGAKSITIQKNFSDNYNYDFFSFYDLVPLKNQAIYKNSFKRLQEMMVETTSESTTLILGSKLSEMSIIEEKYYLYLIKKISHYFQDETLIYIPHREEDKNKLEKIACEMKSIIIKHIDYPVEFYPINENKKVKKVVSFYSTALYTMSKIYNCEAIAFKFNYEMSEHKNNIDEVYRYYKTSMKVIDL